MAPVQDHEDTELKKRLISKLLMKSSEGNDSVPIQVDDQLQLYIGSKQAAYNRQALRHVGISHIVCAHPHISFKFPQDFHYLRVPVHDTPHEPIQDYFTSTATFIQEALDTGGAVFVHCYAGRSRSATLVLAYLIHQRGLALQHALAQLRLKRRTIAPNVGFVVQLRQFERRRRTKSFPSAR